LPQAAQAGNEIASRLKIYFKLVRRHYAGAMRDSEGKFGGGLETAFHPV